MTPVTATLPLARPTDPETSHDAAESLTHIKAVHRAIVQLLRTAPMTDFELKQIYRMERKAEGWPDIELESVRKRRSDLVSLGMVSSTGARRTDPTTGKTATVWGVNE